MLIDCLLAHRALEYLTMTQWEWVPEAGLSRVNLASGLVGHRLCHQPGGGLHRGLICQDC